MKKLTTLLFAFVLTASMAFAQDDNTASSTTNGSHNTVNIDQDGSENVAEVMQSGNSNDVMINQGTLDDNILSNNDEAYVTQTGDGNDVDLASRDGYESSASVIYNVNQQGDYNSVNARAFNAPAEGDIDQAGSHNDVNLTQHTSENMSATISQTGTFNSVNAEQVSGADNSVLQATIAGSHNDVDVTQTNGDWQKLVLDVTGSSNTVMGTLGDHDADQFTYIQGDGNTLDFYQGESSDAGINVSGDYNEIDLAQNGAHNKVFDTNPYDYNGIVVNGSHNDVDVTQNSDWNTATVNISGTFNETTINQGGGETTLQ